jgi:hypothetical protein
MFQGIRHQESHMKIKRKKANHVTPDNERRATEGVSIIPSVYVSSLELFFEKQTHTTNGKNAHHSEA